MLTRTILALPLAFVVVTGACKGEADTAPPADATAPLPPRSTITVKAPDGAVRYTLEPKDSGYALKDATGQRTAKIKVEADRVKLKGDDDVVRAKVKCKGTDAFKLYAAGDDAIAKVKLAGDTFKVARDDGSELARGGLSEVALPSGERVTVSGAAGSSVLTRAGAAAVVIDGDVPTRAALLFAVDALPEDVRIAALAFHAAVRCPAGETP